MSRRSRFRSESRGASAIGAAARGASAVGALALGSLALGAFAVGAVAIYRLAIRRLAIGESRIGSLKIGNLEVGRLSAAEIVVSDSLQLPPGTNPARRPRARNSAPRPSHVRRPLTLALHPFPAGGAGVNRVFLYSRWKGPSWQQGVPRSPSAGDTGLHD